MNTEHVSSIPSGSEPAGGDAPLLELRGVSKAFGAIQALRDVSFSVRRGEILGLVGENGAGKSTLLRTLSGDHQPDEGQLLVDGTQQQLSPIGSRRIGIRVVYQEPELVPTLTVAENIFLGEAEALIVRWRGLFQRARSVLHELGFARDLDPHDLVSDLAPGQRQLVEIAKAVHAGARILALDEPTSALGVEEASRLFAIVRGLQKAGTAVIYVSHRLQEVLSLAGPVVVLRDGEVVATRTSQDLSEAELIRLMVGREITKTLSQPTAGRDLIAAADGLRVEGLTTPFVRDVSFEVRGGEIIGMAGLVGAGRTEVARALYGLDPILSGRVLIGGVDVTPRSPADALKAGICFTPEDRKRDGVIEMRSVRENLSLTVLQSLQRFRVIRPLRERALVGRLVRDLSISAPSTDHPVSTLSGGNQQKVVLARALARKPRVLVLDDPTRGIDVGAKAEVYELIFDLAKAGIAILFISSELPEIIGVSDRVLVMRGGRLAGEVSREEATEELILSLAVIEADEQAVAGAAG